MSNTWQVWLVAAALGAVGCAEEVAPTQADARASAGHEVVETEPEGPQEVWADLDGDGQEELLPDDVEDRRVPPPDDWYDDALVVEFPAVLVPPGGEIFTCAYGSWKGPDRGIVNSRFVSDPSTNHHFIVNSVPEDGIVNQPEGKLFSCRDGDHPAGAPLYNWVKGGEERGIGAPLRTGQRYYTELHSLNTQPHPVLMNAYYVFKLVPLEQVKVYAESYIFGPDEIRIPPGDYHIKSTCTWPNDASVLVVRGHMHLHGVRYALDWTSDSGTQRIFEVDPWEDRYFQEEQPSLEFAPGELEVKAGDTFTTHCVWHNPTNHDVVTPEEMCNTFGVAHPLDGPLECDGGLIVVDQ